MWHQDTSYFSCGFYDKRDSLRGCHPVPLRVRWSMSQRWDTSGGDNIFVSVEVTSIIRQPEGEEDILGDWPKATLVLFSVLPSPVLWSSFPTKFTPTTPTLVPCPCPKIRPKPCNFIVIDGGVSPNHWFYLKVLGFTTVLYIDDEVLRMTRIVHPCPLCPFLSCPTLFGD